MAAAAPAASEPAPRERELAIVLHGIASSRGYTEKIARRLRRDGFEVVNVSYPSRTLTLAEIADTWLPELLANHHAADAPRLHFVAHSMGGLVVRRFLARQRPDNLGRVVMIATPNHGSEVADKLHRRWFVRRALGINVAALGTADDAFFRSLPPAADFPLGVLAGTRPAILGRPYLPRPHDGTVSVESTRLAGMADHRALRRSHTGILFSRETAREVSRFLLEGRFSETAPPGK